MIQACKDHVAAVLQALNVQVRTDPEDLGRYTGALPYAVVLAEKGLLERDGTRVAVSNDLVAKTRTYRLRLYKRTQPLRVYLVHRTEAAADDLLGQFLAGLGSRLLDAGNAVTIHPQTPEWLADQSLLDQKAAVELVVEFRGGVYKDEVVPLADLASDLVVETQVEMQIG